MKKQDIDVSKYLYKPFANHDDLRQYEEFKNIKDDRIIDYVILAYDIKSDIRKEFAHRSKQKVEAAILSGFNFTSGSFDKDVEEILIGENYDINLAIVRYISLFGKPEYMALDFQLEKMKSLLYKQRKGEDDKGDHKVSMEVQENITKLTEDLFGGKEILMARTALYDFIDREKGMMFKPENIARSLENKEDPFEGKTPYGDGFKVEKLRFKGDE